MAYLQLIVASRVLLLATVEIFRPAIKIKR